MKKIIAVCSFLIVQHLSFAQNIANKNVDAFVKNFNEKKFTEIYSSLTDAFKKQISEMQLIDFLQNNKDVYGNIISVDEKDSVKKLFHINAENGKFDLRLICNAENKIAGLQIVPVKDKVTATSLNELVVQLGNKYMDNKNNVGAIVGVSVNGKSTYFGFGETKKGNITKPDSSHIFEIGSITKVFTGSLLADAVLQNKIKLNDPVSKYVPANIVTTKNGKAATIVQLANHTAGFYRLTPNFFDYKKVDEANPYKAITRKYFYNVLSKNELEYAPGTKNSYSNMGVALIGCILEDVYNRAYSQLLNDKIINTLKMPSTFLKVPKNNLTKRVQGYTTEGKETAYWDFDCMAPTGGIKSTANDMLLFLNAQLHTTNASLQKAFALAHKLTFTANENLRLALNWHIITINGKTIYWHNGGTGGFASFGAFEPTKKLSVIVLLNNQQLGKPDEIGTAILDYLLQ